MWVVANASQPPRATRIIWHALELANPFRPLACQVHCYSPEWPETDHCIIAELHVAEILRAGAAGAAVLDPKKCMSVHHMACNAKSRVQ